MTGTDRPSEEIAKLKRAWTDRDKPGTKPLAWTRVHRLPAFVTFDHRSHVNAGVVCATCHGPVDTMHRVRQFSDLTMGWCVNCHRQMNVTGLPNGKPAAASTDCSACHY